MRQVGTSPNNLVALDATAKLPAIDGSQITNLNLASSPSSSMRPGAVVTLSGQTSVTFSSIPTWVNRITVMLIGVLTTSSPLIQLGSGSPQATGYNCGGTRIYSGGSSTLADLTNGFPVLSAASKADTGQYIFSRLAGNTWVGSYTGNDEGPAGNIAAGSVTITAGPIDRIVVSTQSGTASFSAGTVNVTYE